MSLPCDSPGADAPTADAPAALAHLARHQLRANQQTELALDALREALAELRLAVAESRERAAADRRALLREREEAAERARRLLGIVDALDDVHALALRLGDPAWLSHLDRLTTHSLHLFAAAGCAEIAALGRPFDEEEHAVTDTRPLADDEPPHVVIEVLRRGFRWNGTVLRRAQVIITRQRGSSTPC